MNTMNKVRAPTIRPPRWLCLCLAVLLHALPFAGALAQERTVQAPDWPLKVISWDLDRAYPGMPYEHRLGVQGGAYPYSFRLLAAPEGMGIHPTTGTITWLADIEPGSHEIQVEISDQRSGRITHGYTLQVEKEVFRFVAPDGDDDGPGTEAQPWASVEHAVKTAGNSRYVYIRAGSYPVQFDIQGEDCGKLLAYPGERPRLVGHGQPWAAIGLTGSGEYIFRGLDCDVNAGRWFFSVDSPSLSGLILRQNRLYNIVDDSLENPAFLFFWDGPQKPILGEPHYRHILIQENVFHSLQNPHNHGASVTLYNVQDLVYEDNSAYDIHGNGVLDKDDGFRNTFRNNLFRHCRIGIALTNQNTQGSIDVHRNLVHDCGEALAAGWQPGYLRDVFIHHNTLLGSILFGRVLHSNPDSRNINLYHNIIGDGAGFPYLFVPIEASGGYAYPSYVLNPADDSLRMNHNLLWVSDPGRIAGYEWGLPDLGLPDWHRAGFDLHSLLADPQLDRQFALPADSPHRGIYGRDDARLSGPR